MFLSAPPHLSRTKHVAYLTVAALLGVIVSYAVHAGIETVYLSWAGSAGQPVVWYGSCALHPLIQVVLPILGVLGGFVLGRSWWRKVYVDRVWAKGKLSQAR